MARQLTIRGVPDEVASRLHQVSKSRGRSLNATVVQILGEAVGFDERRKRLARYATWTAKDLREFDKALSAQRVVDDELWQ